MNALHRQAEDRYHAFRMAALEATRAQLPNTAEYAHVRLSTFSNEALEQSQSWDAASDRRVAWNWCSYYPTYRFRYPKRFELAIWDGARLAGLSLGRPTYFGSAIRLDVVEGSPFKNSDLRVVLVNLRAMAIYADLIGAQQLRVMNPINDEVKSYYETYGLIYVPDGDYLYRDL